jgi:hypothetical protein
MNEKGLYSEETRGGRNSGTKKDVAGQQKNKEKQRHQRSLVQFLNPTPYLSLVEEN